MKELEKKGSRMLILYGKRRVGKTSLIKKLFDDSESKKLYFFVPKNERINGVISSYAAIAKTALNLKEYERIESFSDLIKLLLEYSKQEKIIVAFDEFQNFSYIYPEAIDILQREWDMRDESSNLSLVASGSVMGMIKDIFMNKNAPLFKRAYNMIEIKELGIEKAFALMSVLGIESFEDRLRLYFLFGGVIFYYSLIDYYDVHSFGEAAERLLLSPVAPLKDTVKNDMIEAFGNGSATYFSILEGIALGKNTNNEIAAYAQLKETSLSQYIYDLRSMIGVIDVITIPTKEFKSGSKKNKFVITDNFYRFWFAAVNRNYSYYEINDMNGLSAKLNEALSIFNMDAFERFAIRFIEFLSTNGSLFHIDSIGAWWGRDQSKTRDKNREEIDIVAINKKLKYILFAECKWTNEPVGTHLYEELKRKSALAEWNNRGRKEHFALFSKSGFTDSMKEIAKKEQVLLFDLKAIENAMMS